MKGSKTLRFFIKEKSSLIKIKETLLKYSQLNNLKNIDNIQFDFTPHLSPMFRGILSTIYVELNQTSSASKILNTLKKYYKKANFIKILNKDKLISTNDVINTNNCNISVCKSKNKNKIIILSAIDNLIKGGAGQAIQNMNMKFNFPKDAGFK